MNNNDYIVDIILVIFVGVPFLLAVISKVISSRQQTATIQANKNRIKSIPGFTVSKMITSSNNAGIAIDEKNMQICLFENINRNLAYRILKPRDLLSAKILENGVSVTNTETKSKGRLGRAVIGGVAFGGVGALLGGLTGKSEATSTSTNYIHQIDLQITLKNIQNPLHSISFLHEGARVSKHDTAHKSAIESAMKWHAIMEVFINQPDAEEESPIGELTKETVNTDKNMVADEIHKLLQLKNQGVITEKEFESQKKKLLTQ